MIDNVVKITRDRQVRHQVDQAVHGDGLSRTSPYGCVWSPVDAGACISEPAMAMWVWRLPLLVLVVYCLATL